MGKVGETSRHGVEVLDRRETQANLHSDGEETRKGWLFHARDKLSPWFLGGMRRLSSKDAIERILIRPYSLGVGVIDPLFMLMSLSCFILAVSTSWKWLLYNRGNGIA